MGMHFDRSPYPLIAGLICVGGFSATGHAETPQTLESPTQTISLWSDEQLGTTSADDTESLRQRDANDAWIDNINRPTLTVYHPEADQNSGTAIVVCPGGGYSGLAIEKEGHEVARWLANEGITAGVLKYRCGGGPHQHPIPSDDARQAVRLFRQHAKEWNVDSSQIGIIGFSAGGHLASTIATDRTSGVNFAALIYPVISMADGVTHSGSRENLLGESPGESLLHEMSRDEQVSESTCPVFLVHCGDDKAVPVENSLRFYRACLHHNVPAEMHLFPVGGHGFGMYRGDRPADHWPDLFRAWLASNGLGNKTSPSSKD